MRKKCEKLYLILNIIIILSFAVILSGCFDTEDRSAAGSFDAAENIETDDDSESILDESTGSLTEGTTEKITESTTEQADSKASSEEIKYPPYSGEAFVEINNNIPDFTDDEKKSTEAFENYSALDFLGRCGVAFANICQEIMPTEERGEIGNITPSGWHTVKYSDVIEDRYLYNRSHLIAFSLSGENANEKNLITGTRYLNQETMQIFELKVLDFVRGTNNHVLYRVTPIFEGDNLLATGVQMEAWSVEDKGESICFNVFCYNVQPNIEIDYATGESRLADGVATAGEASDASTTESAKSLTDDMTETTTEATTASDMTSDSESAKTMDFIVNTNTKKFHLPTCKSVNDMAEHNKMEYNGTVEELKKMGYTPCKRCLGDL